MNNTKELTRQNTKCLICVRFWLVINEIDTLKISSRQTRIQRAYLRSGKSQYNKNKNWLRLFNKGRVSRCRCEPPASPTLLLISIFAAVQHLSIQFLKTSRPKTGLETSRHLTHICLLHCYSLFKRWL